MREKKLERVRVGSKPKNKYIAFALCELDRSDKIIVEGLGQWTDKVLDVTEKLEKIGNVETGSLKVINVDNVSGLKIKITKNGKRGAPP